MTTLAEHRRRTSASCLSDLQIDIRLTAEDLGTPPENPEVTTHLKACEACQTRVATYRQQRREFQGVMPVRALAQATLEAAEARPRLSLWLKGALVSAASAAVAALLILTVGLPPQEPVQERIKGHPSFSVVVKRKDWVFVGEDGGEYQAGDRLRLRYSSDRPRAFAVISLEASGKVTQLVPAFGDRSIDLQAGSAITLDGSIELDDAQGKERLLGVFCDHPFALSPLIRALADGKASQALGLSPDCSTSVFTLHKI